MSGARLSAWARSTSCGVRLKNRSRGSAPGDIGAIPKLTATVTGDTLSQRDRPVALERLEFPVGYHTVAVSPKTKADVDKMSMALSRIVEEDPSLRVSREPDTGEILLSGSGGQPCGGGY